jgi:hypothetical protein
MVGVIAGAVIAVLITILIEYLRRPNLTLDIENPPKDCEQSAQHPAKKTRYLRLVAYNKPLPRCQDSRPMAGWQAKPRCC